MTANFTSLILVAFGSLTSGAPLTVVQLLWLNLIMDTFAAIALGSERPHPSIIKTPPVRDNEPLMTLTMWRQIYGMTVYICAVMIIMYFFVDNMWDLSVDQNGNPLSAQEQTTLANTMFFETFIFMHLFNEINCRKVGATEFNVFHNILANWYFIIVVGGLMVGQWFLVEYGGKMVQTVSLTSDQHAFCVVFGATTLIASALLKLIPSELTEKMPIAVDENKPIDENDPIMKAYNKHANAKVTKPKEGKVEDGYVPLAQE